MDGPLVSICIPTYEPDESFLTELLSSVAEQRYGNLEVVVSDDASSADVWSLLEGLPLDVQYRRNEANVGMVRNWNLAVEASTGALVMLVHQDDVLVPGLLDHYVPEFESDREVVLCSCGEAVIDPEGKPLDRVAGVNRRTRIYRDRERYLLDAREIAVLCLRNGQAYGEPSAVMFRRASFEAVGGYDAAFEHSADIDFNLRVARLGKAVYISTPLVRRRLHSGNLTRAHVADGASSRDRVRLYERHAAASGLSATDLGRARVTLVSHAAYDAVRALRRGRYDVLRENAATVRRYARNSLPLYLEHLQEIVTGVNLDER